MSCVLTLVLGIHMHSTAQHGNVFPRVDHSPVYTVHIRYFWQEDHQIYGIYGVYIWFWPALQICAGLAKSMQVYTCCTHTHIHTHARTHTHTHIHGLAITIQC